MNYKSLDEMYLLLFFIGLSSCSDINELSINDIHVDRSANTTLTRDKLMMLRKELCPINQTLARSCQGICCDNSKLKVISKQSEETQSENVMLVCHTENQITVNWTLQNDSKNSIHLVEFSEKFLIHLENDTVIKLLELSNLTRMNSITYFGLKKNSIYTLCVSVFNNIDEYGLNIGCNDFSTLSGTFREVPHIWLDYLTQNKRKLNGILKWNHSEDYTCCYDVAVFNDTHLFMQLEVNLPKNNLNATIYDLEYETQYRVKITATNRVRSRESVASWINFITPTCKVWNKDSVNECPPESPHITNVTETETNAKLNSGIYRKIYDVMIAWEIPQYIPDYYLISLTNRSNNYFLGIWNITGTDKEANIIGVDIGFSYQISITANSQGGTSKPTQIFRRTIPRKPIADVVTSSSLLWTVLSPIFFLIFIISTALIIYHRHTKKLAKRRCRYFEDFDRKFTKEVESRSGFTVHLEVDPFEICPSNIVLSEMLGEGAFGIVRKGWIPEKGREVAVKMLKDESSIDEIKQFRQEIDMMKSVGSHAHIVSLVGYYTKAESPMMLVVEYCPCGDLLNYLRKVWDEIIYKSSDKPLPITDMIVDDKDGKELITKPTYTQLFSSKFSVEETIANFPRQNFIVNKLYDLQQSLEKNDGENDANLTSVDLLSFGRQIAMGMEYLSMNRVVHRDLAARNVLVCSGKTVKISDFGLSRDIYRENIYKKTGVGKLPIKWMAVESLTHQVYTTQSDVWSYGILLWEIVTLGGNPYPSIPSSKLLKLLRSGYRMECPVNCSNDLYSLMMACWQCRPKDRPTFAEIRQIIDTLLEGMCSHTYLTLDVSNYNHIFELGTYDLEQTSKCNSDVCETCGDSETDRYVKPISVKNVKIEKTPNELNDYSNQPFV